MFNHQKKMPLYVQIKNKMIQNVNDETWPSGASIPSESQLMAQYNVSRTTIRQAVRDLVQAGILETRRGAPTKVLRQPKENAANPGVIHHELGEDMDVKVLRVENSGPHYLAKSQLHLSEDEEVFVLARLRLADQKPIAIQQLFMPKSIGEKVNDKVDEDFDLFPHLGRHNIHYSTIKEDVSACNATRYEADLLGITPGEALIDIERITLGMDQMPIEYSRTKYLPTSFHYRIEIGN
ncbi:GntR family transcriptional regulator [Halobacillus sp. B23F22_1]|uniref:GntR family transcriptional regulator n=1 Tax=Halobacillus sp. B23F22_1 TaxID=3459514 RepID=UPI00373EBE8E